MLIIDPWFYLVAVPAVLLNGISKGGFGGAVGGMSVPLMAIVISPVQAAGIMLPLLCATDAISLRGFYRKWDNTNLRIMVPGSLVGIAVGTFTFGVLSDATVRLLVGSISVLYVLYNLFWRAAAHIVTRPSVGKGVFFGGLSGFTSFIAHAGSPPLVMYLLPQKLDKLTFAATAGVFFVITNAAKVIPYAFLGQFTAANLLTSAALMPLVPFGVWAGLWLQRRVNQLMFYRVTQIGLLVTGLHLVYQGLAH